MLLADTILPDPLADGPGGYFPAGTGTVVFERFAGFSDGRLVVDRLEQRGPGFATRRGAVGLERAPGGGLRPAFTQEFGPDAARAGGFGAFRPR